MESPKTVIISKETTSRILMDIKHLIKNPLNEHGIYYMHDDKHILKGRALIIGPKNTPYFGGYYFFDVLFPPNYPYSPPTITFKTNNGVVRFNPNLYTNGKVCISILNTWDGEPWSACQTLSSVLLTLCSILNENPLRNEPGVHINDRDCVTYHKSIEYTNIYFAVCSVLMTDRFNEYFDIFSDIMIKAFMENYSHLISCVEENIRDYYIGDINPDGDVEVNYYTYKYSMYVNANYTKLLDMLKETHEKLFAVANSGEVK
jgi:ubiquitin-conjugating enzyme E2 Z